MSAITTTINPQGDRSIAIWNEDGSITALLVSKEDFKAYQLFRKDEGLEMVELPGPDSRHRKQEVDQQSASL